MLALLPVKHQSSIRSESCTCPVDDENHGADDDVEMSERTRMCVMPTATEWDKLQGLPGML